MPLDVANLEGAYGDRAARVAADIAALLATEVFADFTVAIKSSPQVSLRLVTIEGTLFACSEEDVVDIPVGLVLKPDYPRSAPYCRLIVPKGQRVVAGHPTVAPSGVVNPAALRCLAAWGEMDEGSKSLTEILLSIADACGEVLPFEAVPVADAPTAGAPVAVAPAPPQPAPAPVEAAASPGIPADAEVVPEADEPTGTAPDEPSLDASAEEDPPAPSDPPPTLHAGATTPTALGLAGEGEVVDQEDVSGGDVVSDKVAAEEGSQGAAADDTCAVSLPAAAPTVVEDGPSVAVPPEAGKDDELTAADDGNDVVDASPLVPPIGATALMALGLTPGGDLHDPGFGFTPATDVDTSEISVGVDIARDDVTGAAVSDATGGPDTVGTGAEHVDPTAFAAPGTSCEPLAVDALRQALAAPAVDDVAVASDASFDPPRRSEVTHADDHTPSVPLELGHAALLPPDSVSMPEAAATPPTGSELPEPVALPEVPQVSVAAPTAVHEALAEPAPLLTGADIRAQCQVRFSDVYPPCTTDEDGSPAEEATRRQLIDVISERLARDMTVIRHSEEARAARLQSRREALEMSRENVKQIATMLKERRQMLADSLPAIDQALQDAVKAETSAQEFVNADGKVYLDLIKPDAPIQEQALENDALDRALEDSIYALEGGLKSGVLEPNEYQRSILEMSRRVFECRVISNKIARRMSAAAGGPTQTHPSFTLRESHFETGVPSTSPPRDAMGSLFKDVPPAEPSPLLFDGGGGGAPQQPHLEAHPLSHAHAAPPQRDKARENSDVERLADEFPDMEVNIVADVYRNTNFSFAHARERLRELM